MREVILSADGELMLYAVPDVVAEHLEDSCVEFCANWLWKSPEAAKYRQKVQGITCVVYHEADFIDYLNTYLFPDQKSVLIRGLGCFPDEIPAEYDRYPQYHF